MSSERITQVASHLQHRPWQPSLPAQIGDAIARADTPALVVSLPNLLGNVRKMRHLVPPHISLRPHYKTHKSNDIAALQLEGGANGLCVAKLSEAEAICFGNVSLKHTGGNWKSMKLDILITNEIGIGDSKMQRLEALAKELLSGPGRNSENRLGLCVDSIAQIKAFSNVAKNLGSKSLDLYVELNHGGNRCGVDTPEEAVKLALEIRKMGGVVFRGLHAYIGTAQHVRNYEERKKKNAEAAEIAKRTVEMLKKEGFSDIVCSGSGTGTFEFDILPGSPYTELQVGSYVFFDRDYSFNLSASGRKQSPFKPSLFVLSTIGSNPGNRVVLDAGWKAVDVFVCMPGLHHPQAELDYVPGGDEHGILVPNGLRRKDGSVDVTRADYSQELLKKKEWQVGEKVWLFVSHCDPTVNLHDWFVVIDHDEGKEGEGKVVDLWRTARGPGL